MRLRLAVLFSPLFAAFPLLGHTTEISHAIRGRDFALNLQSNWIDVGSKEENQWIFVSKEPAASLVVSERLVSVARGRSYEYAAGVVRARKQLEREARGGSSVIFYEDSIVMNLDDSSSELSYFAKDEARSEYVHFIGYLSQFRLHSFWVSVQASDEAAAKGVLVNVLKGFRRNSP